MKIALIVAMDKEFVQLRSLLEKSEQTNLFCCNAA